MISDSVGVPDEVEGVTEAAGATDVDGVDVCSSGDAGVSPSGDAGDSWSGDTVDGSLSIVTGGSGGVVDEARGDDVEGTTFGGVAIRESVVVDGGCG